jgi:hypothetical protein
MDAKDQRTTRDRAIEGLRAIALLEEYVAAEIDGPDDWALLACELRRSATRFGLIAARLDPSPAPPPPPLRLVR